MDDFIRISKEKMQFDLTVAIVKTIENVKLIIDSRKTINN